MSEEKDEFLEWIDSVIDFENNPIIGEDPCHKVQFKLIRQVRSKYLKFKGGQNPNTISDLKADIERYKMLWGDALVEIQKLKST